MQETDRAMLEDAERFRQIWQRVQGGRETVQISAERVGEGDPSQAWDPVPFLQDAIVQSRLREACCRRWTRLAPLAGSYRNQARRLTAALFLLGGVRPVSAPAGEGQPWASLEESCRRLWLWERRAEERYRTALTRTADPELRSLFRELAGECAIGRQRIRVILEGLF